MRLGTVPEPLAAMICRGPGSGCGPAGGTGAAAGATQGLGHVAGARSKMVAAVTGNTARVAGRNLKLTRMPRRAARIAAAQAVRLL